MRVSLLRSVESALKSQRSGHLLRRSFASDAVPQRKVAILGAAGGIGQPLSLLMKLNPHVTSLALYDIAGTPGVAADVSHINTPAQVAGYASDEQLGQALEGSDVIIIPAGVPRKPGMTRDDLFNINAGIVKSLCTAIAKYCPNAIVNMISNPVNSTLPIAAEVFKKAGTYDEKKLFGVTTLDVVRAKTFYAGKAKVPVSEVNVPVVGGHAGVTILPLFSQATPSTNALSDEDITALTKRTQDGCNMAFETKAGIVLPASENHVEEAIDAVRGEKVIAVPTDTLYGFACDACSAQAVNQIYGIKGRKQTSPLAICVSDVLDIPRFASVNHLPHGLLDSLLPGPVTVILKRGDSSILEKSLNLGLDSIGVRVPDSDFIRAISRGSGSALALTSANLSGQPSSVSIKDFEDLWHHCAYVYDGGVLPCGRAGSTVVDLTEPRIYKILRPGSAREETVAILHRFSLEEAR